MQRLLAPLAHVPLLQTLLLRWSSSCPPLHGDGTFERSARVLHVCPRWGRWEVRAYAPIEVEDEVLGDLVDVVLAVDIQFPRQRVVVNGESTDGVGNASAQVVPQRCSEDVLRVVCRSRVRAPRCVANEGHKHWAPLRVVVSEAMLDRRCRRDGG